MKAKRLLCVRVYDRGGRGPNWTKFKQVHLVGEGLWVTNGTIVSGHACEQTYWRKRMTENIAFPQTTYASGNNIQVSQIR